MKNEMPFNIAGAAPLTQRGFALIVALVLLLVMTMVAVIAMRSTTLDLKMTTNNALGRRAFQASESIRKLIGPLLASVAYYGDWPVALGGNELNTNFPPINSHIAVVDATKTPQSSQHTMTELEDSTNARSTTPDIRFDVNVNGDNIIDKDDVKADIWLTKTGVLPGGPRVPGAGIGNYAFELYDVRARGRSAGNAEVSTEADFRIYINTVH